MKLRRFLGRMNHWWNYRNNFKVRSAWDVTLKLEEIKFAENKALAAGRENELEYLRAYREALQWIIQEKET